MRINDWSSDVCSSDLFDEAAAKAGAAMTDLAEYVGSQPGTADGYVLGAETFAKMILTNEGVDTPLAELERIGRADLKRNQDALKAACATYAAGDRKSVVEGKSVSVRVDLGGRRHIKKKKN